jgi:hypothetical protein
MRAIKDETDKDDPREKVVRKRVGELTDYLRQEGLLARFEDE